LNIIYRVGSPLTDLYDAVFLQALLNRLKNRIDSFSGSLFGEIVQFFGDSFLFYSYRFLFLNTVCPPPAGERAQPFLCIYFQPITL
jgi:hypothetical protein